MPPVVSVLRYIPHPARGEAVNVGAVVADVRGQYLKFHVRSKGRVKRLRCIDPSLDPAVVDAAADWLNDYRLDFTKANTAEEAQAILDELAAFMSTGHVQMGVAQPVHFENPYTEADLDELLVQTVKRDVDWYKSAPMGPTSNARSFKQQVWKGLEARSLYVPNSKDSPVFRDPVVGDGQRQLKFDFGFNNGRLNVVEIADIHDIHTENSIIEKAAATILRFELVAGLGDEPPGRIALLSGGRTAGQQKSPSIRRLEEVADDIYFMDEDQERRRFYRAVEAAVTHSSGR